MILFETPPVKSALSGGLFAAEPWQRWFQAVCAYLGTLEPYVVTKAKTAAYTAQPGELVRCDTTGGGFTVTLPLASKCQNSKVEVVKISADGNAVTVSRAGADNINGGTTKATAVQYAGFTFRSDGASRWIQF